VPLYQDIDVQTDAPAADFLNAANALIKAKRFDEARTMLDKALEKDPNMSEVHAKRGLIDLIEKKYDAAVLNFQKKLEMDPKSASTLMNLAGTYLTMGKKAEAYQTYRKATVAAPNSAQVWGALGSALMADSTLAAQKAFDRALQIEPQNKDALKGRGLTFSIQEKYPDAIRDLKAAGQLDPNDAETAAYLGGALLNSGNRAEAKAAYERAIKLDPSNKDAQEGIRIINAAGASR
jgi:tetratricopeptide (TPR) repeat protein